MTKSNDLISRRAAIHMCREPRMRNADCSDFEMEIMMLPSIQPERNMVAEERYEDLCEYFRNDQNTIKAVLHDRKEFKAWLERMRWHVMECDKMQRELDAQKTERKNGKWIDAWRPALDGTRHWHRECSECGYERDDDSIDKDTRFCANCGAYMKGEDGETD